jgi:hypothetical protein
LAWRGEQKERNQNKLHFSNCLLFRFYYCVINRENIFCSMNGRKNIAGVENEVIEKVGVLGVECDEMPA